MEVLQQCPQRRGKWIKYGFFTSLHLCVLMHDATDAATLTQPCESSHGIAGILKASHSSAVMLAGTLPWMQRQPMIWQWR